MNKGLKDYKIGEVIKGWKHPWLKGKLKLKRVDYVIEDEVGSQFTITLDEEGQEQ